MATDGLELVYATAGDGYWGINRSMSQFMTKPVRRGANNLGHLLQRVRDAVRSGKSKHVLVPTRSGFCFAQCV